MAPSASSGTVAVFDGPDTSVSVIMLADVLERSRHMEDQQTAQDRESFGVLVLLIQGVRLHTADQTRAVRLRSHGSAQSG
jgi:hypothetical protein